MSTIPFGDNGAAELSLWPHLNLLESPGLRNAVMDINEGLAAKPEYIHDSLVALGKPSIHQFFGSNPWGNIFDFQGTVYSHDDEGTAASFSHAEFLDISHRQIGGIWRVVFALSAEESDDPTSHGLFPDYVDIDPLEPGNKLFACNTPEDIVGELTDDFKTMTSLSVDHLTGNSNLSDAARYAFRNDMATETDRICNTNIRLGDYEISLRSLTRYFSVQQGHLVGIPDSPDTKQPQRGTYKGMKFIDDIPSIKNVPSNLTLEEKNAPCMVLATEHRQRFYYPLATLASLNLLSFREPLAS